MGANDDEEQENTSLPDISDAGIETRQEAEGPEPINGEGEANAGEGPEDVSESQGEDDDAVKANSAKVKLVSNQDSTKIGANESLSNAKSKHKADQNDDYDEHGSDLQSDMSLSSCENELLSGNKTCSLIGRDSAAEPNYYVIVDDFAEDFDAKIKVNTYYNGLGFPKFPIKDEDTSVRRDLEVEYDKVAEEEMRQRIQALNTKSGNATEKAIEDALTEPLEDDVVPKFKFIRQPEQRRKAINAVGDVNRTLPLEPLDAEDDTSWEHEQYQQSEVVSDLSSGEYHAKQGVLIVMVLSFVGLLVLFVFAFVKLRKRGQAVYSPIQHP